ncbi:MAG: ABC transporter ATP-binding protein [Acidimicrobiia bacterium]|nr:ABC transporter ATP-binding protein [Acidimicrobiia bacterium]
MTSALEVRGLVVHAGGHEILSGVDLAVAAGEVVAVLGPSGSGKTTLLSAVAGFIPLSAGEIRIGGEVVGSGVPPEQRSIGFVFQSYALWPHLDARDTVAFPLRAAGHGVDAARRRADELLTAMGIAELAGRRPAEMSGGQQQRVGVARALARDATLYLLDEPTAHLDAATRGAAESEIAAQRAARGAAALYATHDPAEALGAANRVALMRSGRIVQVGSPIEVYERPIDEWAARMTGPVSVVADWPGMGRVAIRPEWVRLGGSRSATVSAVRFRGSFTDLTLTTGLGEIEVRVSGATRHRPGESVTWEANRVWALPG